MTAPTQRPPSVRRDEPARTRRDALTFAVLVVGSVLALGLPLPWQLATLAFTVGAVVTGVRMLLAARRAGDTPRLGVLVAVGIALSVMTSVSVLSATVVYDLSVARQECLAHAITTSATQECEAEFRRSVEQRLDELMERATRPGR